MENNLSCRRNNKVREALDISEIDMNAVAAYNVIHHPTPPNYGDITRFNGV